LIHFYKRENDEGCGGGIDSIVSGVGANLL